MTTKALKKDISVLSNRDSLEQKVKYSMNLALETVYESPLVTKFFPKYYHSKKKVTGKYKNTYIG